MRKPRNQLLRRDFRPIGRVLTPVLPDCDVYAALSAATAIAPQVQLLGIVPAAPGASISAYAEAAADLRRRLRTLSAGAQVRYHSQVIVTQEPWQDLLHHIDELKPDLLLLDLETHLPALGILPGAILDVSGCDVALVRGPWPATVRRVLMPMRGGPHAELVLNVGISFGDVQLTALHLTPEATTPEADAPFRGLRQVLHNLGEVVTEQVYTDQPAAEILARAADADVIVIGASARPDAPQVIGPVVARLLEESTQPMLIVKRRRVRVIAHPTEEIGQGAISILVDKWFAENTFNAEEFADLHALVAAKHERGLTVSLALPALNEEETVGRVIDTVKRALMEQAPLLDEIVLIDSNSTDRTRAIAQAMDVPVYIHQEILPQYGARRGKGEALWKSLYVTHGDIVAWIDTDIFNIHPRFVYGIIGPLIMHDHVQYVKGFYRRPLKVGEKLQASGGGRVTELMARPLINLFYPELSGVIQPLSGEYAGRRRALEQADFYSGYGVETGMLIDIFERHGLTAIAQVDLLERIHHNQPLEALSKMSFAILQTVMQRLEQRFGHTVLADVNRTMKLVRYARGAYYLDVEEVAERARPPMIKLPEYRTEQARWRQAGSTEKAVP